MQASVPGLVVVFRRSWQRLLSGVASARDGACECALAGEAVTMVSAEAAEAVLALRAQRLASDERPAHEKHPHE